MTKSGMKKILFVITLIFMSISVVYADDCSGLLTQEAADFLSDIVNFVRILIPILLIVLCATDLTTVVISQDDKAMKNAWSRIIKRFIAAACVFFVPLIVNVILSIDAVKNSLNLVDDPTCGIGEEE